MLKIMGFNLGSTNDFLCDPEESIDLPKPVGFICKFTITFVWYQYLCYLHQTELIVPTFVFTGQGIDSGTFNSSLKGYLRGLNIGTVTTTLVELRDMREDWESTPVLASAGHCQHPGVWRDKGINSDRNPYRLVISIEEGYLTGPVASVKGCS